MVASGEPKLSSLSELICSRAAAARARRLCLRLREGRGARVQREVAGVAGAVADAGVAVGSDCSVGGCAELMVRGGVGGGRDGGGERAGCVGGGDKKFSE